MSVASAVTGLLQRVRLPVPKTLPRWARNTLIALCTVFVLVGAIAYFFAPGWVKPMIEQQVQEQTGRKFSVGQLSINPLRLSATLVDIKLFEPDGITPTFTAAALEVNASITSLFRRAAVLDEIKLTQPVFSLVRTAPQRFNVSDIVDRILAQPKNPNPVHFSLNNIQVENGRIDLDDRVGQRQHHLEAMRLGIPFISDLPYAADVFVEPAFEGRLNGSPIALKAESKPFAQSLDSSVKLNLNDLDIPELMSFVPLPLNFKIASGKLAGQLEVAFRRTRQIELAVSGQLQFKQVRLTDLQDHDALRFDQLAFDIDKLDPLQSSAAIKQIQLDAPEIHLTREQGGGLNLTRIFSATPTATTATTKSTQTSGSTSAPLPAIAINQITLNQGRLIYTDNTLAKPFETSLHDIKLNVSSLSTNKKTPAQVSLSLQGSNNASIDQQGEVTLANSSATGLVTIKQLHLGDYAPLAAPYLLARIEDGNLDASSRYAVNWSGSPSEAAFKLDALTLSLKQLRLRLPDDKEPLFSGEEIALSGGSFQPGAQAVNIESIKLLAPKLGAKRNAQGVLNLLALQPAHEATQPVNTNTTTAPAKPFSFLLQSLEVAKGDLKFDDNSTSIPVQLRADNLTLSAQNISTAKDAAIPFELKTGFNKKGQLGVKGKAVLEPLSITASINASKLALAPLQGYAADRLNVNVVNADLSLRGEARYAQVRNQTGTQMNAAFKGNADLNDVKALDRVTEDEFLRFKALKLGLIDLQYPHPSARFAVTLKDIALSDFYARIILNSNARLNLQDIVQQPGDDKAGQKSITTAEAAGTPNKPVTPSTDSPAPAPIIHLGQTTLINGRINYTDNLIRPNYNANLTDLGGVISGMASDQPAPADVNIRGSIDGDGALTISGKINPLGTRLYTDIQATAKDIELTKLSAYSIKYAGYPIDKGKLSMKVSYKIENNQLNANNNLFLDQLTFGDKVESPTATTLPVRFAVSLLQNSRGEIDIDLPISGTLDDPEFSIGGVILQVIGNLLTRAITSPFSLLSAAFGGSDELGYIEFAPGRAGLAASEQSKIEKMSKALADRPSLKLDIIGRVDPENDPEGARQAQLADKVRAQKIKEQSRGSDVDVSNNVSTIEVSADEYPKYLEKAYGEEKFSKPRNLVGIAKSLPVADMEKLILANIKITDDDLRQLANQRADVVRNAIEKIDPKLGERVFLVAPKLNAEGIKDKGKASRVDFALK